MARMLPSIISPNVKSNAERKIFEMFQDAKGTDDWVVLHSLGIAYHNQHIYGEADFFVMVPQLGVFALEVKGGRVRREDGIWYFTNRFGKTSSKKNGPFDQAKDSSFSITNAIRKKLDARHYHIGDIFFGYGVMFPDIRYDTTGIDEEQWQVFDIRDHGDVRAYILRLGKKSIEKWETKHGKLNPKRIPSKKDIDQLAKLLRGDFDKAVSISAQIRYSEEALLKLTEEQYRCLDQIEDNPRSLIQGAAGTGKTLLALEEAKKSVARGEKVALFCYNSTLGDWFNYYFSTLDLDLTPSFVGTFHKYLYDLASKKSITLPDLNNEMIERYFENDLPNIIMGCHLEDEDKFDKIIVDEAQDLITPIYLDIFDSVLRKGFERGNWVFLGDFESQAIYSSENTGDEMKEFLEILTSFIRFKLTINCRNTKPITQEIQTVTGFKTPRGLWTNVEGLPVDFKVCLNKKDMTNILEQFTQ